MRPNVSRMFPQYTQTFEGRFGNMYTDVRRLITVGYGCLIDPVERAYRLDWMIGDRRATLAEVRDDWNAIKSRADQLWNTRAPQQAPYTSCRLTDDAIEALLQDYLQADVAYMKRHMPGWDDFPADAQLGLASYAWARGAGIEQTSPELLDAANAQDWASARLFSRINEHHNAGIAPRNLAQDLCFSNAATVKARGLDPAALWWPNACPKEDSLHTLAVKALELGIAHSSIPAGAPDDDDNS